MKTYTKQTLSGTVNFSTSEMKRMAFFHVGVYGKITFGIGYASLPFTSGFKPFSTKSDLPSNKDTLINNYFNEIK